MDSSVILDAAGIAIYVGMGLVALYGAFCVILLVRRVAQQRFATQASADQFLGDVRERLERRDFGAVTELCDTASYWSKAVPQLIIVALENRDRGPKKLRQIVAGKFERDILADLEYRLSWINTIVKSAPMLGLLGTVIGMILAFKTIASSAGAGADPSELADNIGVALFTTALGLSIAIPLVLAGALINVRIGKLQDASQHHLGVFFDDLEDAMTSREGQ